MLAIETFWHDGRIFIIGVIHRKGHVAASTMFTTSSLTQIQVASMPGKPLAGAA
jgi:hypothetical protein